MQRRRRLFALMIVLAGSAVPFVACGSVSSTTECSLDPQCTTPTSTQTDGGGGDAPPVDAGSDAACKPGDTKKIDCNTCTCSPTGTWLCTGLACVDSGPGPSKCPEKQPVPDDTCRGTTHCIYNDPCVHGCDCVDGHWKCVECGG